MLVPSASHSLPIYPLGLNQELVLWEIDRAVPIGAEERPEPSVRAHLPIQIEQSVTIVVEGAESHLLRVDNRNPVATLRGHINLEGLRLLILIVVRWRRVWRRRGTPHNGLAASLRGPDTLISSLGTLLTRGVHDPKEKIGQRLGIGSL
jgi:hypothetical protein